MAPQGVFELPTHFLTGPPIETALATVDLTFARRRSHACVTRMRLETKFLRLKTPVTVGSRFGDWSVCWLGGWTRHQLSYIVMVVRAIDSAE